MASLAYIGIFARSLDGLTEFYRASLGFAELDELRSPFFRCLDGGGVRLNFFAPAAYQRLGLTGHESAGGVAFLLHIALDDAGAVDAAVARALEAGASLVQPAAPTPYGWYVSVLLDPEGNAFRIGCQAG